MAEKSYIWDVDGIGDTGEMPYDEDTVAMWMYRIFQHDVSYQGVIAGIDGELEVTNPSDQMVRIANGAAYNYGKLYWNDDNIEFNLDWLDYTTTYYRIVLRHNYSLKQIRVVVVGPSYSGYPSITQVAGTTWDFNLADVSISSAGVVSISDQRHMVHTTDYQILKSPIRYGDETDKNWDAAGDAAAYEDKIYVQHTARMQQGTIRWTGGAAPSGNVAVTFPVTYSYKPICVVEHLGTTAKIMVAVQVTTGGVTIYWEDENGDNQTSLDFQWIAAGPIMGGA